MRAKLVIENINFERGKDPRRSMDIGVDPDSGSILKVKEIFRKNNKFSDKQILSSMEDHKDTKIKRDISGVSELYDFDYLIKWYGKPWKFIEYKGKLYQIPKNTIKESINFERGQEPKDSMGIGINANVRKFLEWIKTDYQFDKEDPEYFGYINLGYTGGKGYVFSDPDLEDGYKRFVKDYKKYLPFLKDLGLYLADPPTYDETIIFDDSILEKHSNEVLESINFERGMEPKESMKVGLEAEMERKYGVYWGIFKKCYDISNISENFSWTSEIIHGDGHPYFNIESNFYYTVEDGSSIPVQFIITVTPYYILCEDVAAKREEIVRSVKGFVEFTEAFEDDEQWQGVFESVNFKRGQDPKDSMRIGNQAALKQEAAKIDWDWYPDPEELESEEILELSKYDGFNIKLAKIKENPLDPINYGEEVYYAVSDTGEPYINEPTFYETPEDALDIEKQYLHNYAQENK